jgi:hypothetical protein
MREIRRRIIPFSIPGITRKRILGMLLLAFVATPAALDLCAKEKRRARVAKEQQKQDEAAKAQAVAIEPPVANAPAVVNDAPVAQDQTKGKAEAKNAGPAIDKAKDPSADKGKQENDKAKDNDKPKEGDKTADKTPEKAPDKLPERSKEKAPEKSTVAKAVDDRTRPVVSLKEPKPAIAPALDAARSSRDAIRKIPGYTCTFSKQEQLKKGAPLRQTMSLKFRREPFSVYLKYVDPNAGREVIYIEGRNNGKLQVHEASGLTSLIGTISLSPIGNEALKENKYPLTMIGMEKMLERFIADWEESQKHADTKVQYYPQAKLGEVECIMYEVAHPEKREPFKFHMSRVYFDKKTLLPIRAEQYAFPAKSGAQPQLVEEYTYSDVKADASLSETDFDVKNEKYGFK